MISSARTLGWRWQTVKAMGDAPMARVMEFGVSLSKPKDQGSPSRRSSPCTPTRTAR